MTPKLQLVIGWALFVGSTIAWPVSQYTWAKEEPPTVLALSWIAIILTALTFIEAAAVRLRQERDEKSKGSGKPSPKRRATRGGYAGTKPTRPIKPPRRRAI